MGSKGTRVAGVLGKPFEPFLEHTSPLLAVLLDLLLLPRVPVDVVQAGVEPHLRRPLVQHRQDLVPARQGLQRLLFELDLLQGGRRIEQEGLWLLKAGGLLGGAEAGILVLGVPLGQEAKAV